MPSHPRMGRSLFETHFLARLRVLQGPVSYNSVVALRCPWAKEKCLALQSSGQVRHHNNKSKLHIQNKQNTDTQFSWLPYHSDGLPSTFP